MTFLWISRCGIQYLFMAEEEDMLDWEFKGYPGMSRGSGTVVERNAEVGQSALIYILVGA
jgi:hypothetical protein